jgi:hypothetical protein
MLIGDDGGGGGGGDSANNRLSRDIYGKGPENE